MSAPSGSRARKRSAYDALVATSTHRGIDDCSSSVTKKGRGADPISFPTNALIDKEDEYDVNANVKALDRSGKPCRRWGDKKVEVKSFTGSKWRASSWQACARDEVPTLNETPIRDPTPERVEVSTVQKTSPTKSTPAANKVFQISELLQTVLMCLDMETLFTAQLVSRRFRNTINDTINIQRKLFLAHDPHAKIVHQETVNPLLLALRNSTSQATWLGSQTGAWRLTMIYFADMPNSTDKELRISLVMLTFPQHQDTAFARGMPLDRMLVAHGKMKVTVRFYVAALHSPHNIIQMGFPDAETLTVGMLMAVADEVVRDAENDMVA